MKSGVLMHKDGSGADIANSKEIAPQLVQRLLDDYEQLESESAAKDERIAETETALKMATDTIAEYQHVLSMFEDEGSYEIHVEID